MGCEKLDGRACSSDKEREINDLVCYIARHIVSGSRLEEKLKLYIYIYICIGLGEKQSNTALSLRENKVNFNLHCVDSGTRIHITKENSLYRLIVKLKMMCDCSSQCTY